MRSRRTARTKTNRDPQHNHPTLRFSPTAWAKLLFLRDYGETEVGGFGISREGDLLFIEEIHLVNQVCSWAHVTFDDESLADFFDQQVDAGRKPEQFGRIWIHTHPGDCPLPSPVDEETFDRVFGRADWSLMFILARGGESYARLLYNHGPKAEFEIVKRPAVAGGPRSSTAKRYKACLDKFMPFAEMKKLRYWNEVTDETLNDYAAWLDGEGYAYATEYLELTVIKQVLIHLVKNEHLPADSLFSYPLKKPTDTDTFCWSREQVKAMLDHCSTNNLNWLRQVLIGLASTGLRIMELANLRWSDIDLQRRVITLTDESHSKSRKTTKRTTKSGDSRSFPVHDSLFDVLQEIEQASDGFVFHGPLGGPSDVF